MDPSKKKSNPKFPGFIQLNDESQSGDSDDDILDEILADDDKEEGSYNKEQVMNEVAQKKDPFVVRTQSALTVPTSNLPSLLNEDERDLSEYAELVVAAMVADQKEKKTQKVKLGQSTKVPSTVSIGEAPRIYPKTSPMEEPPRITPVPIFDFTELNLSRKPMKPELALTPKISGTEASKEYYSDPPATLIIRSFKARSTSFVVNHDELSDISPKLQGNDDMTAGAHQEVVHSKAPPSDIEQGSDSALIRAKDRSDDPELGCSNVATATEKSADNKSKTIHRVFAGLLFVFVCCTTGYLVVYILNLVRGGRDTQIPLANGQNGTQSTPKNFVGARLTTPMDPFEPGCSFENYTQPHVIGQCNCNGEIAVLDEQVREKYYSLNMLFISMNISDVWDLPEESCDPRNQAMVWLATTYADDKDDVLQKYVLASFFIQLAGEQWTNQEGWLVDGDKCKWFGLACNDNGMVTSVFLDRNGLQGALPLELSLLESLESLSLRNNGISGQIPPSLFSMKNINELSISSNSLTGSLPTEIALASSLEVLRLDMNSLRGGLNWEIGQLKMMKKLNIGYNQFIGTIPLELFQLTLLEELVMEGNPRISGRLPSELSNLQNMEHFSISSTNILSRIPTQLGALTNLRVLKIAGSQMSGIIPTQIARLTNLNHLDLSTNKFRRSLPTQFGQLPLLTYLSLHDNQLTGKIPPQLGNNTELVHLSLHGNRLSGNIPKHFGYLTSLDTLTLEQNFLTGRAPMEVCNLRREELIVFTTDCSDGSEGVLCPFPSCCTSCLS